MLHKALEGAIILETFPKTTVDVFALVLESGGSKFTVCNNESINIKLVVIEIPFRINLKNQKEKRMKKTRVKDFKFGFLFAYLKLNYFPSQHFFHLYKSYNLGSFLTDHLHCFYFS